MTGHGTASVDRGGETVSVEVRTVNSRYFKLSIRTTNGFASLEPRVDEVVRRFVHRGTVQVDLRVESDTLADNFRLNERVLARYQQQLQAIYRQLDLDPQVHLEPLLLLPGVVDERSTGPADLENVWATIEQALSESLTRLTEMRIEEGKAMSADLLENCRLIAAELDCVERRAPQVVENYRNRLKEKLNRLLAELAVQVEPADVIREVGMFAERSDICEEIVRLRSHLDQFHSTMQLKEGGGRKLDFVTQEMFREVNTIGSKANDAEIATHVIEIKAAIERIREMIQNVE